MPEQLLRSCLGSQPYLKHAIMLLKNNIFLIAHYRKKEIVKTRLHHSCSTCPKTLLNIPYPWSKMINMQYDFWRRFCSTEITKGMPSSRHYRHKGRNFRSI